MKLVASAEIFMTKKHWWTETKGAADAQINVKATEAEHWVLTSKFLQCKALKIGFKKQTLAAKMCCGGHMKPLAAAGAQSFGAQDTLQLQRPKRMSPLSFI